MNERRRILLGSLGFAALLPTQVVIAADYLTIEGAQHLLFSQADHFQEAAVSLTAEQRQTIASLAGPQPRHGSLRIWRALLAGDTLGYFFADEVIGRQDLITYATTIDNNGRLGSIEILSYRESHGGEIRNSSWRNQFNGRDSLETLRFGTDIKNIAGATLSCEHVTQGVRWVFALWQAALK